MASLRLNCSEFVSKALFTQAKSKALLYFRIGNI
jgi:hypothetical protein